MLPTRLLIRAAQKLHAVYMARAEDAIEQTLTNRLVGYHLALERIRAALRQGVRDQWASALMPVRRQLLDLTRTVRQAARQIQLDLRQPVAGPDLGGLIAELRQLEEEFGGLDVDFRCKTVRVTTEPITLEGVYLGPFCLKLRWDRLQRLADSSCFEIEALQPNPASSNEAVTHPHVHSGSLCAGEATTPIRHALEEGRIADAFCLIRSVLTNYNSGSPHVSLEHWDGGDCHDCGCSADTDDLSYCENCSYDFCEDCISYCRGCDENCCNGCLGTCSQCQSWLCPKCLKRSDVSRKRCCSDCLRECSGCGAMVAEDELDLETQFCLKCRPQPDAEPPTDNASVPKPNSPEDIDVTNNPEPALA